MATRIAINGFGRIGRNVLRAIYERDDLEGVEIVAVNDLGQPELLAHLLKYDSVHGTFGQDVEVVDGAMIVGGKTIALSAIADPSVLPWRALNVDIVFECTGRYTEKSAALAHVTAGAKRVLVSAPAKNADLTVVYGVNQDLLKAEHMVVSAASCTTNCLAPIAKALNDSIGIEQGSMTTIHSYTNDQNVADAYHSDLYRARAAGLSMIPTKTGAAAAVGLVLPELAGRLDGMAVRVPTANVSLVDLHFLPARETSIEEINAVIQAAADGPMAGILAVNRAKLVSADFNHNPASSNFDATQTRYEGKIAKVMSWYDNEWGFSNRMLDIAKKWGDMI